MRSPLLCPGPVRRREFLRCGLAGIASLSLSGLLRLRAEANEKPKRERTALLVVWHGGASHLETYDPKPLAPSEYRGPVHPIPTAVPGLQLCELLPKHATLTKRFTMLRSLVHTGPCHDSAPENHGACLGMRAPASPAASLAPFNSFIPHSFPG